MKIVVLISGSGSNLQALINRSDELGVEISAVFSDQPDAYGLQRAAAAGIETFFVDPAPCPDRQAYDRVLQRQIAERQPELLVLAGFMRILSPQFVTGFASRIINIHPSLLPAYRGLHTHRRVLQAGDPLHGCSIHYVTDELDGGPLIAQACVSVRKDDTETSLSARVQEREHKLYPLVVSWIARGRLSNDNEQVWLDGKALQEPVIYAADEEIL